MKRFLTYIACITALVATSCSVGDDFEAPKPAGPEGKLLLNFSAEGSRADAGYVDDNNVEAKVTHVDLFLFATDAAATKKSYHQRFKIPETPAADAKYAVEAAKTSFDADMTYEVYLVGNSPYSPTEMAALNTVQALEAKVVTTPMIHLTGVKGDDLPQTFFMSGKAASAVKINDSTKVPDDVTLSVDLHRAAAKVEVKFHVVGGTSLLGFGDYAGDFTDAEVAKAENYTHAGGYYIDDMAYSASMYRLDNTSLHSGLHVPARRTTSMIEHSPYFTGQKDEVTITAYIYPYTWEEDTHNDAPKLIVNLPAVVKDGAEYKQREQNYYEIRLRVKDAGHSSDDINVISRNTFYKIKANVSALGANTPVTPVEIENITYSVHDWNEVEVNIGGNDQAQYLTLNTYDVEMHNVAVDNTTLRFTSSSEIAQIEVVNAHYIDKFGQTVTLYPSTAQGNQGGWYDPVDESDGSDLPNEVLNASNIYATAASGIAGQITVNTPVPTNDTPRYLTFRVTNTQGLTRDFTVTQYPVISITNVQAYFSYRTDFGSWYTKGQSPYYSRTDSSGKPTSGSGESGSSFFRSKYVASESKGVSDIEYYYWNSRNNYTLSKYDDTSLSNARIYHVTINSTDVAGQYTVGRPRVDENGYTMAGADNARLISPSFMIASQLGATSSGENHSRAQIHCSKYVEVYIDENGKEVHLRGWRLPTEAEVQIITQRQYLPNAAVDEVLSGGYYHSASGTTLTRSSNGDGTYTRCIRDHYPAAGTATNN